MRTIFLKAQRGEGAVQAIKKVLIAVAKYINDATDVGAKENRFCDKMDDVASAA